PSLHCAGARPCRRRAGAGRGDARYEFPLVPLLREEIQSPMTRPVREEQRDARDIAFIDVALVTEVKAALLASGRSHRLRIVVAVTVLVVLAAGLPVTLGSSATQLSTED